MRHFTLALRSLSKGKAFTLATFLTARHYLTYLNRNGRDTRILVNLARCYGRMGNADAAVDVPARAARAGFLNPSLLESDAISI